MPGKNLKAHLATFDRDTLYPPKDAIDILAKGSKRKFDESVDISVRLGVDPRKADQMVRGTVSLPHGSGKTVRVAVFATGENATAATEAGADVVGAQDLVDRVTKENFLEFDSVVATPDMMGLVGKLGKILGPRGLMPNPKTGTVTTDVGKAVREIKAGKLEYRVDKGGNVHISIGKRSFESSALLDNFQAVMDEITRAKPSTAKGKYIKAVTLTSTMGPGIKVELARVEPAGKKS